MGAPFVIRYRYPGTSAGRPVGLVYALDISHLSGLGSWSYRPLARHATMFDTREAAEAALHGKKWPEAKVMELSEAEAPSWQEVK